MLKLCLIYVLLLSMPREGTAQLAIEENEQSDSASQSSSASDYSDFNILNKNPCAFRGRFLAHKDRILVEPCTECTCENGTTTCHVQSCAEDAQCPPEEAIVEEGECCPKCASSPSFNQDCNFRETILQYNHHMHLDPCTVCTCVSHGRTHCHVRSCPSETGCHPSEIHIRQDQCCPVCPYNLVVTRVRISHNREFTVNERGVHTIRFSLHVEVAKTLSSRTVQGEQMWRLGTWISENADGSGVRMSFHTNIFNRENAAKPFHRRNPANFKWPELEYSIEPGQTSCGSYLCVEFDTQEHPLPRNNISFTFQPFDNEIWRLVNCIPYSYCNDLTPKMHTDLTSKRTFERNLGDEIIFECNVTNAHTIWWKHSSWAETKRVSSNSTYRIDNITLADQGSYYCQAKGHVQHIRSAEQILIIPGMLQFLLKIDGTKSNPTSLQEMRHYQMHIANKLEEANILVIPLNASTEANTTFYLNTKVKPGQTIDNIKRNIQDIIEESTKSVPLSNVSGLTVQLGGLSLCLEDLITTEVGNLSFPSVSLNTEGVSNEHCVVPSRLPRGSRRCEGELVTEARWTDLQIRNCFNSSTTEETRRLIDSFFEIIGKRSSLTISEVQYISRDLVDITKVKTMEAEDITQISSVLYVVSSAHSTSPLVTHNTLHTVDKIMDVAKGVIREAGQWSITTSSEILKSVELQLENAQMSGENFALSLPNIEVNVVQISDLDAPISFAVCLSSYKKDQKFRYDALHMPVNGHNPDCKNGAFVYISSFVNNLPVNDLNQKVIPVTFTSYQNDVLFNDEKSRKNNKRLNSNIISASTSKNIEPLPKGSFLRTTFYPLSTNKFKSEFTCVFWNHTLYKESGGWSSEGCHNEEVNDTYVYICKCDHFGNIAVLVDLTNDSKVGVSNNTALVVCIIIIIIMVATICTYIAIKAIQHARRGEIRHQDFEPLELHS